MGTTEKLLEKLTATPTPRNFPWDDLVTLLRRLGYRELTGGGSRRKFIHTDTNHIINLHQPHPGNNLKPYQVEQVIEKLQDRGVIQ